MDFEMLVINGPIATGHLRAMGCAVPILGVTGNMLPDDIDCFMVQGVNELMGKPLHTALFDKSYFEMNKNNCRMQNFDWNFKITFEYLQLCVYLRQLCISLVYFA